MTVHLQSSHRIVVEAPADQAFMFFTPAGEELWVDGWQPTYVHPTDGRTVAGMVFVTGQGDEFTVWTLVDFDRVNLRSRYQRCTPASRTGLVEVQCAAQDAERTEVRVQYTLTALNVAGQRSLRDYEGRRFAEMIDGWAKAIDERIEALRTTAIR